MSEDMVVAGSSLTARQMKEFWKQVANGDISSEMFQLFLDHKKLQQSGNPSKGKKSQSRQGERGVPLKYPDTTLRLRDFWIEFWKTVGGRDLVDDDLNLPKYTLGYNWPIVLPSSVTNEQIFTLHSGPKWTYRNDLDSFAVREDHLKLVDRSPVVLIRSSIEPDSDSRWSYNHAVTHKEIGFISIGQRIDIDAFFTWMHQDHKVEAGELGLCEHLDVVGYTKTSSLDPDGSVAVARWAPTFGEFRVSWSLRGYSDSGGGVRRAVYTL